MNFTSPYVDLPKRLTVRENLRVFADLYGVERASMRIGALTAELDLADLLRRPYGELSAGQRTRVSLAKALLNQPDVLLLCRVNLEHAGHEGVAVEKPRAQRQPSLGSQPRRSIAPQCMHCPNGDYPA